MEDASTIEILNDAQGEYRTLDLNVQLMISRIVLEISVVKVKNRKQSRNSLNDSKWKSTKRLRTETVAKFRTPQFLNSADPFYNESTRTDRGGRYKPSVKALSNQFCG